VEVIYDTTLESKDALLKHKLVNKNLSDFIIEFFLGCMMLSLEYLHRNCILHRDIKPENLVFDEKGYLRITDLGIARVWNPENAKDTSGTPGYMAPEVMCR
jgi:serine/threonine protein kinase